MIFSVSCIFPVKMNCFLSISCMISLKFLHFKGGLKDTLTKQVNKNLKITYTGCLTLRRLNGRQDMMWAR
jgi:hypothetical protein